MIKYAKYLKEKYNKELFENEWGFIVYAIYGDGSMYIDTLWVSEEARNQGKGKSLEEAVIQKEQPWVVYCDVDKNSNNWEKTLSILKSHYEVERETEDKVILFRYV